MTAKGSCALKFQWLGPLSACASPKAKPTESFSFSEMTASHSSFSVISQRRDVKGRTVLSLPGLAVTQTHLLFLC